MISQLQSFKVGQTAQPASLAHWNDSIVLIARNRIGSTRSTVGISRTSLGSEG